jgi:hypothetical protein
MPPHPPLQLPVVTLQKISARVFCQLPTTTSTASKNPTKSGNPITIFKVLSPPPFRQQPQIPLSHEQRAQLAMSCAWESVFVFPPVLPPPSDSVSASVTAEGAVLFNNNNNNNNSNNTTQMAFYMPSGESVSFCAHAAMGGAYSYLTSLQQQEEEEGQPISSPLITTTTIPFTVIDTDNNPIRSIHTTTTTTDDPIPTIKNQQNDKNDSPSHLIGSSYAATYHPDDGTDIMELHMNHVSWGQEPVPVPTTLHRLLRDYHQVQSSKDCTLPVVEMALPPSLTDVSNHDNNEDDESNYNREEDEEHEEEYKKLTEFRVVPLPTFVHAHIENRRKTLVYINSVRALQQQIVPPPPLASQNHYPKACDSIGNSTGLYLYAHRHTPMLPPPLNEDTQNQDPNTTTATTDDIEEIDDDDAWECVSCMLGHS